MKTLHCFISAFSVFLISSSLFAATYIAPGYRIRIWEGSAVSFTDSQYTIGTTTAMGTVKTLKSNSTVINLMQNFNAVANAGGLDLSGKSIPGVSWNGSLHQRLSENNFASGQCVAFAKSMTGAPGSNSWYRGSSLASYVTWNGAGYTLNSWMPTLQSGTMIAHFGSIPSTSPYSANGTDPHVAIFLSWSYGSNGLIDGINVVDQNLIWTISINGTDVYNAGGLIQKHKLPMSCTAGSSCGTGKYLKTFFASNYYIVDVR